MKRLACAAGLVLVSAMPVLGQAADRDWQPVTDERLRSPQDGDWMSYRRTDDVTGFSPLTEINRDNVDDLRLVWAYSVNDVTRWVPTPVVANGIMYVAEGSGRVLAFDAVDGDVLWIHEREYPEDIRLSQAYGKHRGVSIYGDRIYWGTADSYLVALDARTGEQIWEVRTGDYRTDGGHSHPALIVDGKVLLGQTGGDTGVRGRFGAYDADTGALVWELYTVPREGEPGWDTWDTSEVPPLGGAPWNTVSYDPELNLIYFGTGQPYPWAATLRGFGDALYTNSILAVDVDSGELVWHYQLMPEDSWDRAVFESMLVDLEVGGRTRQALIQTSKTGWGIILDRRTGEFLQAFRTAYDNLITGFTETGRPILDPSKVPTMADVDSGRMFEVCPFYYGGRDLNAPSYNPTRGIYYLGVNNACMDVTFVSQEFTGVSGGYRGLRAQPKLVPGYDHVGEFVAFDPSSGERVWTYKPRSGSTMTASALATAGGIVFGGTADREFFALNDETGEVLWETRLNGDISGAPITFEIDGKQYLAVGAGGRIAQTQFYSRLTDTEVGTGSGVMWVFALPD
jgi:alcohol dehydrogenase (cytochrome c)